ncbi:tryptophan synthase subunit alpha [candidate division KSB1 bacterium]|nr:tryptophan synthase subunit alpha [candidate division KSB1 bacterium]
MKLPLQNYIESHREQHRKLLSLFLTAGFPQSEATLLLLKLLDEAGADLIELGMPFSDPLADGPTIQLSSQIALQNGVTAKKVLAMAAAANSQLRAPLILMGYYNPILQFGPEEFVRAAAKAGVQGLIIPDLPPEESLTLRKFAGTLGVSLIYLVSPNTSEKRLALIDELTTSFIYAVSILGVTGAREKVATQAVPFLERLRQQVRHPVLVGFGVANAADARHLAAFCDGIIVGSALLHQIEKHWPDTERISDFVAAMRRGLDEKREAHF